MSRPGERLSLLCSWIFARDTMEHVIGPALADLQWLCSGTQSSRWRRSRVCLHAYFSFWAAVIVHLGRTVIDDSDATGEDRHAVRRVLFSGAAIVVVVTALLMAPGWFNRAGLTGGAPAPLDRDLVRALPLLIPQATPISIPAGMLFGTLWAVRKRASRSVRRMVLVLGVACSLFSVGMFGWVIPEANQAYRVAVYQKALGYQQPLERGANELTWGDLRDRINEANTRGFSAQAASLQLSYHGRIALVATPLIFALLALALVRQPRRAVSWVLGLLLFVGYYTLIGFDRLVGRGTLSPVLVAWTPNIVAVMLAMIISASSRFSALEP